MIGSLLCDSLRARTLPRGGFTTEARVKRDGYEWAHVAIQQRPWRRSRCFVDGVQVSQREFRRTYGRVFAVGFVVRLQARWRRFRRWCEQAGPWWRMP